VKKKILLILSAALLFTIACILTAPATPTEAPNVNSSIATSVALTLAASGQALPGAAMPTPLPTMTEALPPTVAFTPTIALTATPSVPMASVSVNTNCRTGPGKVYDYIGALVIGEKAEIVGKNTSNNYWVIKNPDASGNCWLWGYYATVAGNTANLTEYIVPSTPTPSIPVPPSNFVVTHVCGATMQVTITWKDNSGNETGFNVYQDGVLEHMAGENITTVSDDIPFVAGTPIEFSVSAFNGTGESARQVASVTCP
jgi:hypothetical protein